MHCAIYSFRQCSSDPYHQNRSGNTATALDLDPTACFAPAIGNKHCTLTRSEAPERQGRRHGRQRVQEVATADELTA